MGNSASSSSPPPEPPPPPPAKLTRRLTQQALGVISEQSIKSRFEAEHYKDLADETRRALDEATDRLDRNKEYAVAAVVLCSTAAAAVAGVFAGRAAQKANAAALARVSQEMVDLRRRGAAELQKAERFGSAQLAKSLIPALDAMDALCDTPSSANGGGEAEQEGKRLTRAALHDALRANGIEVVAPALGDKFDVAAMEAVHVVPIERGRPSGLVESILRPGYVLHGERVLRAAQVGVGAAQESNDSGSGGGGPDGDGGGSAGSTA